MSQSRLEYLLKNSPFRYADEHFYKYFYYTEEKIIGVSLFSNYFIENKQTLSNKEKKDENIKILSSLATIFADEGDFIGEYNEVCGIIKDIIHPDEIKDNIYDYSD